VFGTTLAIVAAFCRTSGAAPDPKEEITSMRGRRWAGGLIVLWLLAAGCGNQATPPTQPSATREISAGGLNASGSGSGGTFTLQVSKSGAGSGMVTSNPSGISCGTTCSRSFSGGTAVTLTAVAASGSVFAGWSGGGCMGTGSCAVQINNNVTVTAAFNPSATPPPPPPQSGTLTFIESTLPDGNVGADYAVSINTTGGSGPEQHRFSLVAGSLPDGLQMQNFFGVQSTLIHGRPTRIQTSTFTVRVDDGAETATRTFTIRINAAVTLAITLPGPTARAGTLGQFYFQNLFASGGRTPYTWSITGGALPPGLRVIRASNGNRIEGTPTARGTFTFNLTVRDQDGQQATQVTSITIN
jgi:Putative Ig domain/Divergent InlB B-repeat domain